MKLKYKLSILSTLYHMPFSMVDTRTQQLREHTASKRLVWQFIYTILL